MNRSHWPDELFDALAAYPDRDVRRALAQSDAATPEQRARLIGDPSNAVVMALIEGPYSRWRQPLPVWAYWKLADRHHRIVRLMLDDMPRDALTALAEYHDETIASAARTALVPAQAPVEPLSQEEAEAAAAESPWGRVQLAREPGLAADLITALCTDPDPEVRLAASMRPELSEEQRAAIDYRVSPNDRLPVLDWVLRADGEQLRRCVSSAHPGLRRSAACNGRLTAEQIETLAADNDFPVRLLLCENQAAVPADLVVRTYVEARVITRGDLLRHPALADADLTRYANSPHWQARGIVVRDHRAPAELIERLSHDEHPGVRCRMAGDGRLARDRVLELFEDPQTTEAAAANPNLPIELMHAILDAADDSTGPPEDAAVLLGHTAPSHEPITDI